MAAQRRSSGDDGCPVMPVTTKGIETMRPRSILRLGVAYLMQMKHVGKGRACSIFDPKVKPVSYTGPRHLAFPQHAGKLYYYPGWHASVFLQSSQPKAVFSRLCRIT